MQASSPNLKTVNPSILLYFSMKSMQRFPVVQVIFTLFAACGALALTISCIAAFSDIDTLVAGSNWSIGTSTRFILQSALAQGAVFAWLMVFGSILANLQRVRNFSLLAFGVGGVAMHLQLMIPLARAADLQSDAANYDDDYWSWWGVRDSAIVQCIFMFLLLVYVLGITVPVPDAMIMQHGANRRLTGAFIGRIVLYVIAFIVFWASMIVGLYNSINNGSADEGAALMSGQFLQVAGIALVAFVVHFFSLFTPCSIFHGMALILLANSCFNTTNTYAMICNDDKMLYSFYYSEFSVSTFGIIAAMYIFLLDMCLAGLRSPNSTAQPQYSTLSPQPQQYAPPPMPQQYAPPPAYGYQPHQGAPMQYQYNQQQQMHAPLMRQQQPYLSPQQQERVVGKVVDGAPQAVASPPL